MANKSIVIPTITVFVFCILRIHMIDGGATVEQMSSAGKMVRDICQPKFPKVTNEMADGVRNGKIPDDRDSKCYLNCILEMMQLVKKGKYLYESAIKQTDVVVPDDLKDSYRNGFEKCKNAATGIKDNCDASHALVVCFYKNIDHFIFP